MPRLPDGRAPVISDTFHMRETGPHNGVDVMYRRPKAIVGVYPLSDFGSKLFEAPLGTPVLAAAAGKIWSTGKGTRGNWVVIDHGQPGGGLVTFYQHLEKLMIPSHNGGKRSDGSPAMMVQAGDLLGTVGYDPSTPQKISHLHFELRQGIVPIDPGPRMKNWRVLSSMVA